jgi:ABC-type branched-subunit amino acid transport system ATPase component
MSESVPGATEVRTSGATATTVRLRCTEVAKRFGGVAAVAGASLTLGRGEILGLIGPNGAGKSTLLDILAGRIRPDTGSIELDGRDVTRWGPHARAGAGMIRSFQLNSEFGGLTVLENVMIAAQRHPGETLTSALFRRRRWKAHERQEVERARSLLHDFGLTALEREYARNLSGGQKRLLELSRAVMASPQLLLLDEPTVGINAVLIPRFVEHVRRLAAAGVSCLLVEHSLQVVSEMCSRVVVMAAGREIAEGTFDEVVSDEAVKDAYLN